MWLLLYLNIVSSILVFSKGLKRRELHITEMRTCLSSFSDFFKDLACVPHDTVKNVEETTTTAAGLNEVKKEDSKDYSNPQNTLVEKDTEDVEDVDSVYDEEHPPTHKYRRSTTLEACLILAPLFLGVFYSYVMTSLIYYK